jgi:hypothetical protein
MYAYSEQGIMISKYDYSTLAKTWGKPIEVSEDAKTFIFKKTSKSFDIAFVKMN